MQYRAAIFLSTDEQSEMVMTGPEHATLSEGELIEEAVREADRIGLLRVDEEGLSEWDDDVWDDGRMTEGEFRDNLYIGNWRERSN